MATHNIFELLGDEEADASAVIERAAAEKKQKKQEETQPKQHQDPPKLPSKPLPPAQAVSESKVASQKEIGRGKGGGGRGYGNRDRDFNGGYRSKEHDNNGGSNFIPQEAGFQRNRSFDRSEGYRRGGDGFQANRGRFHGRGRPVPNFSEDGVAEHNFQGARGGGRFRGAGRNQSRPFGGNGGGFGEGQQQRAYVKKDAAEGMQEADDKPVNREDVDAKEPEMEKPNVPDNQPVDEPKTEIGAVEEKKEEESEDKEMLLDDYYKVLDEKTKHLKVQKCEERKVVIDKDFERMTIVEKKQDEGDFVKLGSDKDKGKRKEVASNKDEKARKNVSINEFLKPTEGEYVPGNRRNRGGRGRGEGFRGGFGGSNYSSGRQSTAPRIEDPSQFPTLGGA